MRYSSGQTEIEISVLSVSNWCKNIQGTYSFSVLDKYGIGPFLKKNSPKVEKYKEKWNLLSCHYYKIKQC